MGSVSCVLTDTELLATRQAMAARMARIPRRAGVPAAERRRPDVIVVRPPSASPRHVVYVHGGALALGSAEQYEPFASHLAADLGANVWIPDYPLAPAARWPAPSEFVAAVCLEVVDSGVDPAQLLVVGDSAGAAVALDALARLDDAVLPAACGFSSPWVDLGLAGRSVVANQDVDTELAAEGLAMFASMSLGGAPVPELAPPRCPVVVQAGGSELLLDDALRMATLAARRGGAVSLEIVAGAQHNLLLDVGVDRRADEAFGRFVGALRSFVP